MRNRCLICFQKGRCTSRCPEPTTNPSRQANNGTPEGAAHLDDLKCYNCGTPGHYASQCPEPHDARKVRSSQILKLCRLIAKQEQRGIYDRDAHSKLGNLRRAQSRRPEKHKPSKKQRKKMKRKQKRKEGWRKSAMNPKNRSLARPPLVRSQAITEREQAYCLTLDSTSPSLVKDETEAYYADRAARMVDELTAEADAKTEPPQVTSHSNPLDDFLNFDFANSPPPPSSSPDSWTWEDPRWAPNKLIQLASPLEEAQ